MDQALQALHTCLRAGIVEEKPVEKTKENYKKSLRIKHGFAKAHLDIGDLLQNKNKLRTLAEAKIYKHRFKPILQTCIIREEQRPSIASQF